MKASDYIQINRQSWDAWADIHFDSAFYDVEGFLSGNTSLKHIELELLGDLHDKSILHLQCHFGLDTLSLARAGARVTGIDISPKAIHKARELNAHLGLDADFICCDVYDVPQQISRKYDIVFSSYGTIGWLPDLDRWAQVITGALSPGGRFVFVEFHPVVWMFDDAFKQIAYSYFNTGPIREVRKGSYADEDAEAEYTFVSWNHSLSEVFNSLLAQDFNIDAFQEYPYSPYPCFKDTRKTGPEQYIIPHLGKKIPMVYALQARKHLTSNHDHQAD